MIIKKYSDADFHTCVELFIRVFNQEPWNDRWSREAAEQYLSDFIHTPGFRGFVAEEAGKACGFLVGVRKKWWSGDEFFINEMCVDSGAQRGGIGTALIRTLTEDLSQDGITQISLLTNKGIAAEAFYKKNGFETIERLMFMSKEI